MQNKKIDITKAAEIILPYNPVHTVWDLGVADTMSIWFLQFVGAEVHVIDYEEFVGKGLSEIIPILKKKKNAK